MADVVGIEIQLRENLTAQLRTMLPLMTNLTNKTKELETLLYQAKGVKQIKTHLDAMSRSLKTVDTASKTLTNTYQNINRIGQASSGATKQVSLLGRAFGGLASQLGIFFSAYRLIQGIGAMAGEGLDFQSKVVGLSTTGMAAAQQQAVVQQALSLGGSGKYVMSGGQFLEAARGVLPVLGTKGLTPAVLPEMGRFMTAARRSGVEIESPEILARFWELYGRRTPKDRASFDEALLKTLQFSKINPGQLLYQSNIAGGSLLGQDPITAMQQLAFFVKESGSGIGGAGGGGRGRAGFAMQSIDRMISQGKIPVQTAEMWHQLGWLPGIEKYMTAKGRGHSYLIEEGTDKHVLHGVGAAGATGKVTSTALREYFLKEQPPWLAAAGKDESLFARQMVIGGARIAGLKGTPQQLIDQFAKLPDEQQKHLLAGITGGTVLANTGIIQMAAGRYKTSFDIMKQGIAAAPGMAAGTGFISVQQQWEQMMASFKSFADALGNNADVTRALSNIISNMSSAITVLNDNIKPIAATLSALLNALNDIVGFFTGKTGATPTENKYVTAGSTFARQSLKGVTNWFSKATLPGASNLGAQAIIEEGIKAGASHNEIAMALGVAMQESGLNPLSTNSKSGARGLFQLMPFGTSTAGKFVSNLQAYDPHFAASNFFKRMKETKRKGAYSIFDLPDAIQRSGDPGFNSKVFSNKGSAEQLIAKIDIHIGNKKIDEHIQTVTAKRQMKTMRTMSYAAGPQGGSSTPNSYSSGGKQ